MYKSIYITLTILLFSVCSYAQSQDTSARFTIDLASTATNNNFPLPYQVIKFKQELALTAVQLTQLNQILKTLALKKTETSISDKRNEHMLDSMFRTRRLNEGAIIFYTNRYGLYQGELRGALLLACYNTRKVLTAAQLSKFNQLQKP